MGKHINELRRKASNESLAKRAKELVKKWRNMVLPDTNGQLRQTSATPEKQEDSNSNPPSRKRPVISEKPENVNAKKFRMNGTSELDYSDNSNSSFKDVIKNEKRDVLINSDSNSSFPEIKQEPSLEQQQPKKRGRKKGSKNHRNLLDEAETSFTNKMAVSRGNAKVKTTQELVESLQNKIGNSSLSLPNSSSSPLDNLLERAAKLTERVSIIDQKLNTNSNRYKNSQKKMQNKIFGSDSKNDKVIESGVVVNITNTDKLNSLMNSKSEDEIIVVDDDDEDEDEGDEGEEKDNEDVVIKKEDETNKVEFLPKSLSVEEALALLPPVDVSCLEEADEEDVKCTCKLKEPKTSGFSIDDNDSDDEEKIEFLEDCNCEARSYLQKKYHLNDVTEERVISLHTNYLNNINGNYSLGSDTKEPELNEHGLYVNVVPNVNTERIPKNFDCRNFKSETFKKYSISDCSSDKKDSSQGDLSKDCESTEETKGDSEEQEDTSSVEHTFREWHEVVELPSYNGEILRILPYVIID